MRSMTSVPSSSSPRRVELLMMERIEVWSGPWQEEPVRAGLDQAKLLLQDERRYSYEAEAAHRLERVYFVNVENMRDGTPEL